MAIEFIKDWIVDIVYMSIFISFLEIVLPRGNMKRFIDMIIGFLIIIVVINPFIKFINKDIDIERNIFTNMNRFNIEYTENDSIEDLQQNQITSVYINKIKEDIKDQVEYNFGYKVIDLNVLIVEDMEDKDYGQIRKIELILEDRKDENIKDENIIKVDNTKEVWVKWNNNNTSDREKLKNSEKIVNIISKQYNLPKDRISVYLNRKMVGE
ncbi:stage III sporulation protein AF [Sporanaerobacter acetigenes]|uniref:stage III sporulation protein AF n=1 Tax=Sporanaerobacter acetigenes TaxID=165813 RepID=UPI00331F8CDF